MSVLTKWVDAILNTLLSPALWLGIATAAICSLAFYAWFGGGSRQLIRDLVAGLAGFAIGQWAGALLGLEWLRVGQVQLLAGIAGAAIGLFVGQRLWQSGSSAT